MFKIGYLLSNNFVGAFLKVWQGAKSQSMGAHPQILANHPPTELTTHPPTNTTILNT